MRKRILSLILIVFSNCCLGQPLTYFCYDHEPETPLPAFSKSWHYFYSKTGSNGFFYANLSTDQSHKEITIPLFNFSPSEELCSIKIQFDIKTDSLYSDLEWWLGVSEAEPGPALFMSPYSLGKVNSIDEDGNKIKNKPSLRDLNGKWLRTEIHLNSSVVRQLFNRPSQAVLIIAFESSAASGSLSVDNICIGIKPCLPGLSEKNSLKNLICKSALFSVCPGPK